MPGGLLQLVRSDDGNYGGQMEFLVGNPEISFFKFAYKRHTNFAMESVSQQFNTKPVLSSSRNLFTCRIGRIGDLLQDVCMCYTLPDIYSDDTHRFQWVRNMSHYMIHSMQVRLDSQLVDQSYGDWMDVWNELALPLNKRNGYERMTGNTSEQVSPTDYKQTVIIRNNRFSYKTYPEGTRERPSIPSRTFYVPLNFWFTKNPGLALPMVALQYQHLDITVEFRALDDLYQLWDNVSQMHVSKAQWCYLNDVPENARPIGYFLTPEPDNVLDEPLKQTIDIDAYLECNFIFLDTDERVMIASSNHEYLVERVIKTEMLGIERQASIPVTIQNPIKEFLWTTRRSDVQLFNDWSNLTNSIPENALYSILKSAKVMMNGMDRFEEKQSEYFNLLQPYQFHTNSPRQGIYTYSFSLMPESIQPSGVFNAAVVNKIQLYVTMNDVLIDDSSSYTYDVAIYSVVYNMFRVMSGSGAMAFAM